MFASDVPNLTRDDARARAELLHVQSYEIELDLTDGGGKPSERTFGSTTTVRFTANHPGESTFIDIIADALHSVQLNGVALDVSDYRPASGITLPDLAADNVLIVDADLLYTNTGEGLHRFVDPLDGETYLYSQFETADAKRMYACFDQPDLKATFTITTIVPDNWEVASNADVAEVEALRAGKVVAWPAELVGRTIADGTRTQSIGRRNLAHMSAALDDIVTVSEDEIRAAMRLAAEECRLVVEPSGALSIAALRFRANEGGLAGLAGLAGPIVAVVSGGNVDPARYLELLGSAQA